jgi:hypothetical protein
VGTDQPRRSRPATTGQPDRPGNAAPAVLQPAGAPATDRDAHGERVRHIAATAARLAGLPDPDAHAARVAAACRLRQYADWRDGLADALRLSEGMTYKCALAGMAHGGGKTVVVLPDGHPLDDARRRAVLHDVGDVIDSLHGSYATGPDAGTGPADMVTIHDRTSHVFCRPEEYGGSGDPSPHTAAGLLSALRAVCRDLFSSSELAGPLDDPRVAFASRGQCLEAGGKSVEALGVAGAGHAVGVAAGGGAAEVEHAPGAVLVSGVDDDPAGECSGGRQGGVDHPPRDRQYDNVGRGDVGRFADGSADLSGQRRESGPVAGEADGDVVAGQGEPAGEVPADVPRTDDANAHSLIDPRSRRSAARSHRR